ncbi:hypothetical protein VOLCADRAFT_102779 [Volvox carteri f. nagariensis]|uniref:Uncharacterized protein n=1 Tax=Volvox carteri f. nagariensis TaxID=3068 RepID=D8TI03_VOLCA|nr:uncharacterized protein VOLCADRAFT_102779 [Volvox carteri f. nagariensis]EFJ52806.1 hypothetical protein VOLCADRAFT_102779 [Volvox carteri f. nagariensis]|eukprot:XP_002945811.1 hypothetical protein VOLCADRAFT_102779 [Volvox carteri f. nagariensis]
MQRTYGLQKPTGTRPLKAGRSVCNPIFLASRIAEVNTIQPSSSGRTAGMEAPTSGSRSGESSTLLSPMFGRSASSVADHRLVASLGSGAILTSSLIAKAANLSIEELSNPSYVAAKVAYQGVPGAYSEVAARKSCPDFEPLPCDQFEVAFQALSQWMSERAVLPIENSLGGSIHAVYDLLIRYRLHIIGETSLAINHCLVALPGSSKGELKRVMSHPQALAQCDAYLRRMSVVKEAVDDTAGAAQIVARQGLQGVGAICSRRAAELYGLDVLEEGIQDVKDNVTRFIVLSRDPLVTSESDTRSYKTSIVFSLQPGPGQLFKALSVFALRDIDLAKVESRPMRTNPIVQIPSQDGTTVTRQNFNYLFYVDFVGSLMEVRCQNALRHLQETAPFLRVLGSYPMDMELGSMSNDDPAMMQNMSRYN